MSESARIRRSRRALLAALLALSTLAFSAPLPGLSSDAEARVSSSSLQKRAPAVQPFSFSTNAAQGFAASHRSMSMPSPSPRTLSRVASFGKRIPSRLVSFHESLPPGFISQQLLPTALMYAPDMIQSVTAWRHRKDGLQQQQQQQGNMVPPGAAGGPPGDGGGADMTGGY